MREIHTFDPDSIHVALARNLPDGLRALADAIEAKQIDGELVVCRGHGYTSWRDTRAHIRIVLDVAAQVFEWKAGEKVPLLEVPKIALPSVIREQILALKDPLNPQMGVEL